MAEAEVHAVRVTHGAEGGGTREELRVQRVELDAERAERCRGGEGSWAGRRDHDARAVCGPCCVSRLLSLIEQRSFVQETI